jgi:hypothetical protein
MRGVLTHVMSHKQQVDSMLLVCAHVFVCEGGELIGGYVCMYVRERNLSTEQRVFICNTFVKYVSQKKVTGSFMKNMLHQW